MNEPDKKPSEMSLAEKRQKDRQRAAAILAQRLEARARQPLEQPDPLEIRKAGHWI